MGIFAELLCGTGGRMMMKLAYERPIMRAEAFATNAYCNGCHRLLDWTGDFVGKLVGWVGQLLPIAGNEFKFSADTYQSMINQETGRQQYYYVGSNNTNKTDTNTYFLEFSAREDNTGNFYLYRDEAKSGYYDNVFGTQTKSGVGTLEVSSASNKPIRWEKNDITGVWYSDYNCGRMEFEKETAWTMS